LQPYRCQLCGEVYLGGEAPDRCPYCGAAGYQMIPAAEWYDYGAVPMSEGSRKYCEEALGLELSNTAYYKASAAAAETKVTAAIFKRLSKQEQEHADLISKMLGQPVPAGHDESAPADDTQKFVDTHAREKRATILYQKIAAEAPEDRVKEVFLALIDVETEHLKLSNIYR
jgi:rubrerythrin/rubredoxin